MSPVCLRTTRYSGYGHLIDVPQEELVKSATFRYITDAITPDEALAILKAREATKKEREAIVRSQG
jgi:L-fuconate dehydratase